MDVDKVGRGVVRMSICDELVRDAVRVREDASLYFAKEG